MRPYEVMYILDPQLDEEAIGALVERFEKIVTDGGGEIEKTDRWGKRRLAYEIDDRTEGFYVVMNFRSESAPAKELERVMKISDGVIRHLLVRREEP